MIYLVLGMHKSGTTLVARALHASGIPMGQEFPQDADYASVKFEARWAQEITDGILGIDRKRLSLDVTSQALPVDDVTEETLDQIRRMAAKMNDRHESWGFKDPRTALTYRYWRRALPPHRLIIIYRDPVEVWRRYARVNHQWWSRKAFKVWRDYNECIVDAFAVTPDSLILKFENLLTSDEEWGRLERFVGKPLVDVRDPAQSRFRAQATLGGRIVNGFLRWFAGAEVRRLYRRLDELHRR